LMSDLRPNFEDLAFFWALTAVCFWPDKSTDFKNFDTDVKSLVSIKKSPH